MGCGAVAALLFAACSGPPPRSAADVRAEIARRMPAGVADRKGWANDLYAAFATQDIEPSASNLCAAIAVIEQESTFRADPPVPGLPRIARAEIDRRAAALHVPRFVVDAALKIDAPDGRSYGEHLAAVRTEQQLSEVFEQMISAVPMGSRLLGGLNPVHTAGPMQVSIAFAQAHARGYPYPREGSVRHEVFSRRGGLYFGVKHLLGYRAPYADPLYRFADFNAGWYASRNAAFQAAAARAAHMSLALDGDLLRPGASRDAPSATELVVRTLRPRIDLDDAAIHRALAAGDSSEFEDTGLYREVFDLADAANHARVPRAMLPEIALHSPKITRRLTTAWFARRAHDRWTRCMRR
ncbi:MAG TPA: DUF1615 domain-containing protein [Luteimonas sp.]|nr:DUF1615 domain-containing protein [Luteimonas sp.]